MLQVILNGNDTNLINTNLYSRVLNTTDPLIKYNLGFIFNSNGVFDILSQYTMTPLTSITILDTESDNILFTIDNIEAEIQFLSETVSSNGYEGSVSIIIKELSDDN